MRYRAILFDKDGTLLDYGATWMPLNRKAALAAADGDPGLAERLLAAAGYDAERDRVRSGSPLAASTNREIAAGWAELLPGRDVAELTRLLTRLERRLGELGRATS